MSLSQTIFGRLHDQFIRKKDCDVILAPTWNWNKICPLLRMSILRVALFGKICFAIEIVLRAASSFCDPIISNKFTNDRMEVGEGIEGVAADNENDGRTSQQVLPYRIIIILGSKFLLNFFYDNGGSAVKNRETAGVSWKNNSGYWRFLEIYPRLQAFLGKIAAVTGISWEKSGGYWTFVAKLRRY